MKCLQLMMLFSSKYKLNSKKLLPKPKIKVSHYCFYQISSLLISAAPVAQSFPIYEPLAIRLVRGGKAAPCREFWHCSCLSH